MPLLHFIIRSFIILLTTQTICQANDLKTSESAEINHEALNYFDALVLGITEGVTEFLPISSTGHLILCNELLGLNSTPEQKFAVDAYAIVIQAGAIAAVCLLYRKRLLKILRGFTGKDADGLRLGRNILIAFVPAAILGLLLNDIIEKNLFGIIPIVQALIGGALLMLIVERWKARKEENCGPDLHELSIRQCLIIGMMQSIAMWPGTSRSMMTIVGGYMCGLSAVRSAEFSFLLGLITLTAAAGYKLLKDGKAMFEVLPIGPVLFGCFIATVFAAISVKWMVAYLSKHGLSLFAWYRIALAILVLYIV